MKWCSINGFKRVSKSRAERLYKDGDIVYLCPHKLRPGDPWRPEVAITRKFDSGDPALMFEHDVARFEFYNCNYAAGKYPAYYVKESIS